MTDWSDSSSDPLADVRAMLDDLCRSCRHPDHDGHACPLYPACGCISVLRTAWDESSSTPVDSFFASDAVRWDDVNRDVLADIDEMRRQYEQGAPAPEPPPLFVDAERLRRMAVSVEQATAAATRMGMSLSLLGDTLQSATSSWERTSHRLRAESAGIRAPLTGEDRAAYWRRILAP